MSQPALSLAGFNPDRLDLPDVQAEAPAIPLVLDEAGITDLRYPITLHQADGSSHQTVATTSFAASVAGDTRGVHMSRFVETLHDWHHRIAIQTLCQLLTDLRDRMAARDVVVKFEFPLFLEREAPVSGGSALVAYDCSLEGNLRGRSTDCTLTTRVPITSLCPCSREISDYGAHNQRGSIEISVSFDLVSETEPLDFGDLITAAEEAGSAPIYSLLKRTDERYVTMQAYENPAFVEDITRAVASTLRPDPRIRAGRIRVVNEESIHSHNAYAAIQWATSLTSGGASPQAARRRRPRIVLVVACSQRKRIAPPLSLRLSSIDASIARRAERWSKRLTSVAATRHTAEELYMGDHWKAALQAYELASRYSSRTELWVISAGYGLIPASSQIKSYSATFASGSPESVWRGARDGDRDTCLRQWWGLVGRGPVLADLVPSRGNGTVVVAAGAAYLTAISTDLDTAIAQDSSRERVSVISAGARGNGARLPVSGLFRGVLGGTDSSLNARLLARLAADAPTHGFRRTAMETFLDGIAQDLTPNPRLRGRPATDTEVLTEIEIARVRNPAISRTAALRLLRRSGVACEQSRYTSLWVSAVGARQSR